LKALSLAQDFSVDNGIWLATGSEIREHYLKADYAKAKGQTGYIRVGT